MPTGEMIMRVVSLLLPVLIFALFLFYSSKKGKIGVLFLEIERSDDHIAFRLLTLVLASGAAGVTWIIVDGFTI